MGKTAFLKVSLIPRAIITASGATTVKTLALANIRDTASRVNVVMKRGGVSYSILSNFTVPGKKTISVFLSKDVDLYLEDGDSIEISTTQEQMIDAVLAYEGATATSPSPSSSSSSVTASSSSSGGYPNICPDRLISSYLGVPDMGSSNPAYPPYCYETYGCRGVADEFVIYTKGLVVGVTSGISFQGVARTRIGSSQVINGTLEIVGTQTNGNRQPWTLQIRPVDSGGYPVYPNWVDGELVQITNVDADRTGGSPSDSYYWNLFNRTWRIQIETTTFAPGDTRHYYYLDCV